MRLLYLIIGALAFLSALMWFYSERIAASASTADSALRLLDEFEIAESMLHRDLLSARAGMLRNYDSLTRETARLRLAVASLQAIAAPDAEVALQVARLSQRVAGEDRWTEQFKTGNAILQNSMAFFGVVSAKLSASDAPEPVVRQVSGLATSILYLTLEGSPASIAAVEAHLDSMIVTPGQAQADTLEALKAHARLLRTLLPQAEGVLRTVLHIASGTEPADLRALVMARRVQAERRASVLRYILFGISLLLALMLAYLARILRQRAAWLRKRAAIEHGLATVSARFINSRSGELGDLITHALQELGSSYTAERAYLVVAGAAPESYGWTRDGEKLPPQWPVASIDVARQLEYGATDIVHVADSRALSGGAARDSLASAGVHAWLCVRGRVKRQEALLGFDFARPNGPASAAEFGLLRMAFDVFANAIDRDAMERDRVRLEGNLQQARRMESVGSFASGIAHNFNNIIGAIVGFAESAQAYPQVDDKVAQSLGEIRGAGARARSLVDQILAFGRRTPSRRTPTHLHLLVAEAKSLLDASLPTAIHITVLENAEAAIVDAEPSQLQQVILNLCNNAAQAMEQGGQIEIGIDLRTSAQTLRLDCGELGLGPYAVLSVTDTGRGMEPSVKERIFEPFFTTRAAGNGLGLATVREIVLEHGGALGVRSAPGLGTRFEIWLRCLQSASHRASGSSPVHDRGRGESILVLEVNRERLLRHEEFLAALGYEPVGFTHAAEAVAACHLDPSRFDAALLCHHSTLPESVLAVAASLHKDAPSVPLILAASSSRDLDADKLASVGVAAVIGQPLTLSELAHTLARYVRDPLRA